MAANESRFASGIIPAYAGNTTHPHALLRAITDHPRLRGEHNHLPHGKSHSQGSSPPTRGTHVMSRVSWLTCGIIPAYAGNTLAVSGLV